MPMPPIQLQQAPYFPPGWGDVSTSPTVVLADPGHALQLTSAITTDAIQLAPAAQPTPVHHTTVATTANRPKAFTKALSLFSAGLLLRLLPNHTMANVRPLLPTDWKPYARVALGVGAARQLNQALGVTLPPWASAIETVAIIHPLVAGFSRKAWTPLLLSMPLIAGVAQGLTWLGKKLAPPLEENAHIPQSLTRLVLSIGTGLLWLKGYPQAMKALAKQPQLTKHLPESLKTHMESLAGTTATLMAGTCARGCSQGLICLSELSELLSGLSFPFLSARSQKEVTPLARPMDNAPYNGV